MSEKKAYKWLKDNVMQPGDRIDRLENIVVDGMPDVNGCVLGSEFWMEIKAPTEPKRPTTPLFGSNHKLSQDQKNWILRQLKAKGNAYIFIVTDKRRILISGKYADNLNEMTVGLLLKHSMWNSELRTDALDRDRLRNALIAGF